MKMFQPAPLAVEEARPFVLGETHLVDLFRDTSVCSRPWLLANLGKGSPATKPGAGLQLSAPASRHASGSPLSLSRHQTEVQLHESLRGRVRLRT
jgi:hypothetical protein